MRALLLALALLQAASVPSPVRPPPPAETAVLPEGTRLHAEPDEQSLSIEVLDAEVELPVLERRGEWLRVRWGAVEAWVLPGHEGGPALLEEQAEIGVEAVAALVPGAVDRLLGVQTRRPLGGYTLRTDVRDATALEPLAQLAGAVELRFRARAGIDPGPPRGEEIVIFAAASSLQLLEGAGMEACLAGGLAPDTAALTTERRDADGLHAAFVHVLVHLLIRRAGLQLRPWIREGLAEDLAFAMVPAHAVAGLRQVHEARARGRLSKNNLIGLAGWASAGRFQSEPDLYPLSAFLIRYLLDGIHGADFRKLIASSRSQPRGDPAELQRMVYNEQGTATMRVGSGGRPVRFYGELEQHFEGWLAMLRLPSPG